jgi:L-alanine-DL-glutamate epimerase-like enolase superfamily enzyme
MQRRDLLKALPAAALATSSAAAQVPTLNGVRMKITDIKIQRLKLVKSLGTLAGFNGPWDINTVNIGGGSFIEVHTDQGLVGIGPAVDPVQLPRLKRDCVGRDPFDLQHIISDTKDISNLSPERHLELLATPEAKSSDNTPTTLIQAAGRGGASSAIRGNAALEIAIWDIIGKACNQPLYKMWGPVRDTVRPYASQSRLGDPVSRAELAVQLKSEGWKAIKFRAHFADMKDDIALVEETRKRVGDDFDIMCDANQATNWFLTPDVRWDFKRAVRTAKAYKDMNVYWLEEPQSRFDYEHLAELNRMVEMPLAGGEGNIGMREFRDLLVKGCFDIVQPEVLFEGPTEIRKIAAIAESMDKRISPHLADGRVGTICNMHLIASLPNAEYLEIDEDLPLKAYSNGFAVFEEPPVLQKNGEFNMPQGPGLGVSINKDMIIS